MLKAIDHPYGRGERGARVYDSTFENVQAGERTAHLFRLANLHRGLVIGTGDLSELALGWCTYGVGDQMAHYSVNSSVPKTLIQHLIRWEVGRGEFGGAASETLQSIVDTEISPELVPPAEGKEAGAGEPAQSTEEAVGPFELQDFHLYYLSRYGYRPSRVAYLARQAWGDRNRGAWLDTIPEAERGEYSLAAIRHWLEVFLVRFFGGSQFKRSALPNGPKVGRAGRCRRARTGGRRPTADRRSGWRNCAATCREGAGQKAGGACTFPGLIPVTVSYRSAVVAEAAAAVGNRSAGFPRPGGKKLCRFPRDRQFPGQPQLEASSSELAMWTPAARQRFIAASTSGVKSATKSPAFAGSGTATADMQSARMWSLRAATPRAFISASRSSTVLRTQWLAAWPATIRASASSRPVDQRLVALVQLLAVVADENLGREHGVVLGQSVRALDQNRRLGAARIAEEQPGFLHAPTRPCPSLPRKQCGGHRVRRYRPVASSRRQ